MAKQIKNAVMKINDEDNNEPFVVKDDNGVVLREYDSQYIDVIKKTVAKGATDPELYMFLQVASSYGLNPFKKEIWFSKFNNKVNIMVSRDGYMKLAKDDPNFISCTSEVVFSNDDFKMIRKMGVCVDIPHEYGQNDRGELIGAYAVLHRKDGDPIVAYVDFNEYTTRQNVWKSYPQAMIRKVAETIVCKQFAGITGLDAVETMPRHFVQDASNKHMTDFRMIDTDIVD